MGSDNVPETDVGLAVNETVLPALGALTTFETVPRPAGRLLAKVVPVTAYGPGLLITTL